MKRNADFDDEDTDDSDSIDDGDNRKVDGSKRNPHVKGAASTSTANKSSVSGDDYRQRCRELNRISKIRCRQRRKDLVKDLESKINHLSAEHNTLQTENGQLRQEFEECCRAHEQRRLAVLAAARNFDPMTALFRPNPVNHNAASVNAGLKFHAGGFNYVPQWDNRFAAWQGAQQPPLIPPAAPAFALGAPTNQLLDPRLIPLVASLNSGASLLGHDSNPFAARALALSDFAQAPPAVADWIRENLQAVVSHQQAASPPAPPEGPSSEAYEASSENDSEDSENESPNR